MGFKKSKKEENINTNPDIDLESIINMGLDNSQEEGFMDMGDETNSSVSFSNGNDNEDLKDYKPSNKKENKQIVKMSGDLPTDQFVIIGAKRKNFGKVIAKFFTALLSIALFIVATCIVFLCLSFKIVKGNVVGSKYVANYNGFEYSIVSRNYQPNLKELKVGEYLVCTNQKDWIPIVNEYEKIKYTSRNGHIIFVETLSGDKKKIESTDIKYILKEDNPENSNDNISKE